MRAVGAEAMGGRSDGGGGAAAWRPPARESLCRNVLTNRSKRTKPTGPGADEVNAGYDAGGLPGLWGMGILPAEEDAAVTAGCGGRGRVWNGHGV